MFRPPSLFFLSLTGLQNECLVYCTVYDGHEISFALRNSSFMLTLHQMIDSSVCYTVGSQLT